MLINCQNSLCNKETNNPKFCSRSCSAVVSNKTTVKRKKTIQCKNCNKLIYAGYIYCKECYKPIDYSLKDVIYDKHHKSSAFALVRARARATARMIDNHCKICKYSKHIEVCHIKPISSFPIDTKLSIVNHISNLVKLCPNCHWEYDHGLIAL